MDFAVIDSRILVKGSLGSYNPALILQKRKMKPRKVFMTHNSKLGGQRGRALLTLCWPNACQRVIGYKSL